MCLSRVRIGHSDQKATMIFSYALAHGPFWVRSLILRLGNRPTIMQCVPTMHFVIGGGIERNQMLANTQRLALSLYTWRMTGEFMLGELQG